MSFDNPLNSKIILAFGEGGHTEQMRRLIERLELTPEQCISIVDRAGLLPAVADKQYVLPPLRDKYGSSVLKLPSRMVRQVAMLIKIYSQNSPDCLISTGPGICLLPALLMRMKGGRVVYIETWCRFRSRSLTGRLMYKLANRFYIQNISLSKFYPHAVYCGRL